MEGRPHDPRVAKRLSEQAARTAATAAAAGANGAAASTVLPRGPMPGEEDELMRLMRTAAAAQQRQQQQQRAAAAGDAEEGVGVAVRGAKRVAVTAREMAALKSALPSPKKFKGAKLAEQLEIKQAGERLRKEGWQLGPR